MIGDVHEREVVAKEAGCQHPRRHERGAERRDERVPGRLGRAAGVFSRLHTRLRRGVEAQSERDDESRPPELSHLLRGRLLAVYFEGHFVTIEPGVATKVPFCSVPSTTMSRPDANRSGTLPVYTTATVTLDRILDVTEAEPKPACVRVARRLADDAPTSETVPVCPASSLGFTDGVPPPAIEV